MTAEAIKNINYIPIKSLQALAEIFPELKKRYLSNSNNNQFYIHYEFSDELNDQSSLMKLSFSSGAVECWFNDLSRRPVPKNIREIIQRYLHEEGLIFSEKSLPNYFHDYYQLTARQRLEATISGETFNFPAIQTLQEATENLEKAIERKAWKPETDHVEQEHQQTPEANTLFAKAKRKLNETRNIFSTKPVKH